MNLKIVEALEDIDLKRAHALLKGTYWAKDRTYESFLTACSHSLCYGLYLDDALIGFARIVTDYATMFYLGDVVIDPDHRKKGYSVFLLDHVLKDPRFDFTLGMLLTSDAHGLYAKFGFARDDEFMSRNKL